MDTPTLQLRTQDHSLSALDREFSPAEIKRLIRDIQYELTSAWKFFLGLGTQKSALVVVDGFTTLPLSLARNCAHVTVMGLGAGEIALLQKIAIEKGVSNYSCVEPGAEPPVRKYELLVLAQLGIHQPAALPDPEVFENLLRPHSEIWIIAYNKLSIASAKRAVRAVLGGSGSAGSTQPAPAGDDVRFPFGTASLVSVGAARNFLQRLNCSPFVQVSLSPGAIDSAVAEPHMVGEHDFSNGATSPALQRIRADEILIGARRNGTAGRSFLTRFLRKLPRTELRDGRLVRYHVSPGGKVLVFATFQRHGTPVDAVLKLPLNPITGRRLALNQKTIDFLAKAPQIGESRHRFFPAPLAEGMFEQQPFTAEAIIPGKSGDQLKMPQAERDAVVHEIFSFWMSIQRSLVRKFYFEKTTFVDLIESPLFDAFAFFDPEGHYAELRDDILAYLHGSFMHHEFCLSMIHGDFSEKNLIFDPDSLMLKGVIDWDMTRDLAFPILDVFHFFVRAEQQRSKGSPVVLLHRMLSDEASRSESMSSVLQMYMEGCKLDETSLPALTIVYWTYRVWGHLGTFKSLDAKFAQRNFHDPLQVFKTIVGAS